VEHVISWVQANQTGLKLHRNICWSVLMILIYEAKHRSYKNKTKILTVLQIK